MFKKISALLMGLILLFSLSCSAGNQEDLAELVGNVFGIQSMAFMMMLYGMPVENAEMVMNEDQTQATVTYTDYVIADALAAMGASPEDAGEMPLTAMSGTVVVNEVGAMDFDLTLAGAFVTELVFTFDNATQSVSNLTADGKEYDINETLQKMAEEQMKQQQEAEAQAAAEAPQIQTVE